MSESKQFQFCTRFLTYEVLDNILLLITVSWPHGVAHRSWVELVCDVAYS